MKSLNLFRGVGVKKITLYIQKNFLVFKTKQKGVYYE